MFSDDQLVRKAQKRDMGAFEELVRRYDQKVMSIALNYAKSPEDAEDICQEVFLRVFRALPRFRFRSQFSTWLFRVATNACLSNCSRSSRHRAVLSLNESPGAGTGASDETSHLERLRDNRPGGEQQLLGSEIRQRIERAVDELSPQQRLVFSMRHFNGLKLREIAEMMGCAEGTVKKYLFLATERMRESLSEVYRQPSPPVSSS